VGKATLNTAIVGCAEQEVEEERGEGKNISTVCGAGGRRKRERIDTVTP